MEPGWGMGRELAGFNPRQMGGWIDGQMDGHTHTVPSHVARPFLTSPKALQPSLGQGWVSWHRSCHGPLVVTSPSCSVAAATPRAALK